MKLEWNVLFICDKWNLSEMCYVNVLCICILLPFFPCVDRKKSGDNRAKMQAVCELKSRDMSWSQDKMQAVCLYVRVMPFVCFCHEFCMLKWGVLYVSVTSAWLTSCMCHECWLCHSSLLLYIKHCNAFHCFHSTLII